jgi:hypothetical protein
MKYIILPLIAVSLLAISCKERLTHKRAKDLIVQAMRYPQPQSYEFTKTFTKNENTEGNGVTVIVGEEDFKKEEQMIERFEKNKLIAFEEIPHSEETTLFLLGTTVRTWTQINILLTPTGKKYLLSENASSFKVKLGEWNVNDITNILEFNDGTQAELKYAVSTKGITPFGECFDDKNTSLQRTAQLRFAQSHWIVIDGSER